MQNTKAPHITIRYTFSKFQFDAEKFFLSPESRQERNYVEERCYSSIGSSASSYAQMVTRYVMPFLS